MTSPISKTPVGVARKRVRLGAVENPTTITMYGLIGLVFTGIGTVILLGGHWIAGPIFGVLGLFFLGVTAHTILGRMRYGNVVLELDAPVPLGTELVARLVLPGGAAGAREIEVELRCKRVEWTGTGKERALSESVVWGAKARFSLALEANGAASCDIQFRMPENAPVSEGGSSEALTHPGIYWEIQVCSDEVEGVDLMRGFRFPVVASASAADRMGA